MAQFYWGGPEMLAGGERAQRQLGALGSLTGSVGSFAKRYWDYAKEGKDLQRGIDQDAYRVGAQARTAQQEATSAGTVEEPTHADATPLGTRDPKPTVTIDDESGAIPSAQSQGGASSASAEPSFTDKAVGGLTMAARKLLAPWGLMDDPEREALLRKRFASNANVERRKSREAMVRALLPTVEDPGAVARSQYPELPSGIKRKPDRLSSWNEVQLALEAAKDPNGLAAKALREIQRAKLEQARVAHPDKSDDPTLSHGYEEHDTRTFTLPDGSTVEGPGSDQGLSTPYIRRLENEWRAQHPDWDRRTNPIVEGPRRKNRVPLGRGASGGSTPPGLPRPPRPANSPGPGVGTADESVIPLQVGDPVELEAEYAGIPAGTKGQIMEAHDGQPMVKLDNGQVIPLAGAPVKLPASAFSGGRVSSTSPTTVPAASTTSTTMTPASIVGSTTTSTTAPPRAMAPGVEAIHPGAPLNAGNVGRRSGISLTD